MLSPVPRNSPQEPEHRQDVPRLVDGEPAAGELPADGELRGARQPVGVAAVEAVASVIEDGIEKVGTPGHAAPSVGSAGEKSNSPASTPRTNSVHSVAEKYTVPAVRAFELRTAMLYPRSVTSQQLPKLQ
jgi:hypothetical protein